MIVNTLNLITHTHGFSSAEPVPFIFSHKEKKDNRADVYKRQLHILRFIQHAPHDRRNSLLAQCGKTLKPGLVVRIMD